MRAVVARALEVRARHGILGIATEAEVDRAIAGAGFGLREDRPYEDRLLGRFFRGTVCVKQGLWPAERLMVKSHELGHGVLGHEAGWFIRDGAAAPTADVEVAATVFAYALLVGRPARSEAGLDAQMRAAFAAGVPLPFLCTALTILVRRVRWRRRGSRVGLGERPLADPRLDQVQHWDPTRPSLPV